MILAADAFPAGWQDLFAPNKKVGIGFDVATTEGKKSNPAAIAITQELDNLFAVRLVIRWKSADDQVARAMLRQACQLPHGLRPRAISIDASSERFFAQSIRREFAGIAPVRLVVSGETVPNTDPPMNYKLYLGNLLVNTMEDNRLALAPDKWLEKDLRQVKRDRGTFQADVDESGNHGDCFDAIKLSLYSLIGRGGGAIEAHAASPGSQFHRTNRTMVF